MNRKSMFFHSPKFAVPQPE
jgi:hypothetical protein